MKRTILSLVLALLCVASQAQVNPKVEQLFKQFDELSERPRITKTGGKYNPTRLEYVAAVYYSPNMIQGVEQHLRDSLLQAQKERTQLQVATIRHTLDELQEEAAESYHYEYHKNGRDTIVYAMNLSSDTITSKKFQTGENHPFFLSDEYLNFDYRPYDSDGGFMGNLHYVVNLPLPDKSAPNKTLEALTADIQRLFKQNKIKSRKALWQHDKQYSDSAWVANSQEFIYRMNASGQSLEGVTNVEIFTVPLKQEQLALQLLHELDSIAYQFTEGNHEFMYRYVYGINFQEWGMLTCFPVDGSRYYSVSVEADKFGFHFVIAQTEGSEWAPRDWPCIKSFVNGKITYFKGMEPGRK